MLEIYQAVADSTSECFLVCDSRGLVTVANRAFRERLGLGAEELLQRPLADLVAADHRQKAEMLRQQAGEQPSEPTELSFVGGGHDYVFLPVQFFRRADFFYLQINEDKAKLLQLTDKLDRQIANAIRIHRRSLPDHLPVTESISFAAHYAAADSLGGDLYSVFKVNHDLLDDLFEQYVCFLTDVSGHGLDSAMLSIFVRETISSYFKLRHQPGELVSPKAIMEFFIEQYMREDFPEDFFVCLYLTVFDLRNRELAYCSAGFQTAPLVADSSSGEITRLACGGLPISSALPPAVLRPEERVLTLSPGMTFLFSTDGLPDQRVGEEVFAPRLEKLFAAGQHLAPGALIDGIKQELAQFLAGYPISDDITVVAARLPAV